MTTSGRMVELTEVIDTSGAYIPGHGTPTVILVGRNRLISPRYSGLDPRPSWVFAASQPSPTIRRRVWCGRPSSTRSTVPAPSPNGSARLILAATGWRHIRGVLAVVALRPCELHSTALRDACQMQLTSLGSYEHYGPGRRLLFAGINGACSRFSGVEPYPVVLGEDVRDYGLTADSDTRCFPMMLWVPHGQSVSLRIVSSGTLQGVFFSRRIDFGQTPIEQRGLGGLITACSFRTGIGCRCRLRLLLWLRTTTLCSTGVGRFSTDLRR